MLREIILDLNWRIGKYCEDYPNYVEFINRENSEEAFVLNLLCSQSLDMLAYFRNLLNITEMIEAAIKDDQQDYINKLRVLLSNCYDSIYYKANMAQALYKNAVIQKSLSEPSFKYYGIYAHLCKKTIEDLGLVSGRRNK